MYVGSLCVDKLNLVWCDYAEIHKGTYIRLSERSISWNLNPNYSLEDKEMAKGIGFREFYSRT